MYLYTGRLWADVFEVVALQEPVPLIAAKYHHLDE